MLPPFSSRFAVSDSDMRDVCELLGNNLSVPYFLADVEKYEEGLSKREERQRRVRSCALC